MKLTDISKTMTSLTMRFNYMGRKLGKTVECDRQRLFCSMTCNPTDAIISWVKDICKELDIPRKCIVVCGDTYGVSDTHIAVELGRVIDDHTDTYEGMMLYLIYRRHLKNYDDFTVSEDIKNVEFYQNGYYFCSVGEYKPGIYEVFELHHGAKVSDDGKEWLSDGELWQYKTFKSLKAAVDFALSCRFKGELPRKPINVW